MMPKFKVLENMPIERHDVRELTVTPNEDRIAQGALFGNLIELGTPIKDAVNQLGLNYPVSFSNIYDDEGNEIRGSKQVYGIKDGNRIGYGLVSKDFQIIPNEDVFGALESLNNICPVRSGGILADGKQSFLTFDTPSIEIKPNTYKPGTHERINEIIDSRLIVRNSFDKLYKLRVTWATKWRVCTNGLVTNKYSFDFSLGHRGEMEKNYKFFVEKVQELLAGSNALKLEMAEEFQTLANLSMGKTEKERFDNFQNMLNVAMPIPVQLDKNKVRPELVMAREMLITKIQNKHKTTFELYKKVEDERPLFASSLHNALQPITEVNSWGFARKPNDTEIGLLSGPRFVENNKALEFLTGAAKVGGF